jgi:hypothetical protein
MFTIAQNNVPDVNYDGACFGDCSNGNQYGRWDEVVGGELVSPCQNTSSNTMECTIEYQSGGSWNAGSFTSGCGTATATYNDQSGLDGIELPTSQSQCSSTQSVSTAGKFTYPLPTAPSTVCGADSNGDCAVQMSKVGNGTCDTGMPSPHGGDIYVNAYKTAYDVFKMGTNGITLELQETATQVQTVPLRARCTVTTTWTPNNPAVYYNDSSLP